MTPLTTKYDLKQMDHLLYGNGRCVGMVVNYMPEVSSAWFLNGYKSNGKWNKEQKREEKIKNDIRLG